MVLDTFHAEKVERIQILPPFETFQILSFSTGNYVSGVEGGRIQYGLEKREGIFTL